MKSESYKRIKTLIFLLLLDFLHGYEYFEEGPSALLLFIQKNGINQRISDRGVVLIPQDHSKPIPDGTIVLNYQELVNMHESGHVQSEMIGLYYFDAEKHYIGSGKGTVKEILTWGKKAKQHKRNSAKIVLTPISNNPIVFLLYAFRNIRHTLSYDFNTLSKLGRSGHIKGNSAAILVMYDQDWYEQGPIGSLAETYLNMDAIDREHSKFYFISDILGKPAKHFAKVTISTGDIPITYKERHEFPETDQVSTISKLEESFEGPLTPFVSSGNDDPYQQVPVPMVPGIVPTPADIPWLGGQVDMSYLALQTPSIMVPINIQDLIAGSMGPLFQPQGM